MLALQPEDPGSLLRPAQRGRGPLGQRQKVKDVGAPGRHQLANRGELLPGVLAHRLQQREDRLYVLVILLKPRCLGGPVDGPPLSRPSKWLMQRA